MAKLKITQSSSITNVTYPKPIGDRYTGPESINGAFVGGTGGDTSQTGRQIQGQSYVKGSSSQTCFIIAQKGSHKFRVQDATSAKGTCTLVNSPSPTAGQMNILLTLNTTAANVAAANVAGGATSTYITYDTRTAVTGPVSSPRVGDYLIGSFGGNVNGVAQVTAVNAPGNVTVATTGNVVGVNGVTISTCTYASKINNRHVWDWYSDGQIDSTNGITTFNTSGYNPTRYRYHLSAPDSTFIQVQYA
jgi:hypothetical protein